MNQRIKLVQKMVEKMKGNDAFVEKLLKMYHHDMTGKEFKDAEAARMLLKYVEDATG